MPPRGRPRKRDVKMEAALKAMRPYGFSPDLVEKTARELLKKDVYGDQGWVFIEQDCYQLLIEQILAQEAVDEGIGSSMNNSSPVAKPRSEVVPAGVKEGLEVASLTTQAQDLEPLAYDSGERLCLPPPPVDGRVSKDTNFEQKVEEKQKDTSMLENKNADIHSPPPDSLGYSSPMGGSSSRKRHKPCHGWIDSDSDEEMHLVELTPAPLPEKLRRMLDMVDGLRRPGK